MSEKYDPLVDLTPVALVISAPFIFVGIIAGMILPAHKQAESQIAHPATPLHPQRQSHSARGASDAPVGAPREEQIGSLNCRTLESKRRVRQIMGANPLKPLELEK